MFVSIYEFISVFRVTSKLRAYRDAGAVDERGRTIMYTYKKFIASMVD